MNRLFGYVYLFTHSPFLLKIGVSNDPKNRVKQVSRDVVSMKKVMAIPTIFPYIVEGFMKIVFWVANTKVKNPKKKHGSGYTEFYRDIFYIVHFSVLICLVFVFFLEIWVVYFVILKFTH